MNKEYSVNVYVITDSLNVPNYINNIIDKESTDEYKYAFFIQNDIFANLIDKHKIFDDYINFMKKWDIPFVMYPYYIHMNSVLPGMNNLPNPTVRITINKETVDALNFPAYGFLGIDLEKCNKINFRFNKDYPTMFYLQDMMEMFYEKGMTISNCCYLDIPESWKYFKTHSTDGYHADINKFNDEKKKYHSTEYKYVTMNDFIEKFKEKYQQKKIEKVQVSSPLDDSSNITVLNM